MLLSGPPSLLIVVQPGVEVNAVVHAPPPEPYRRDPELAQERYADAEIIGGLFLSQTTRQRTREGRAFHGYPPLLALRYSRARCRSSSCSSWRRSSSAISSRL